jgi:hypothetical protein
MTRGHGRGRRAARRAPARSRAGRQAAARYHIPDADSGECRLTSRRAHTGAKYTQSFSTGFTGNVCVPVRVITGERSIGVVQFARAGVGGAGGHEAPRPRWFPASVQVVPTQNETAEPIRASGSPSEGLRTDQASGSELMSPSGFIARGSTVTRLRSDFNLAPRLRGAGRGGEAARVRTTIGVHRGPTARGRSLRPRDPQKQCTRDSQPKSFGINMKRSGGGPVRTWRACPGRTSSSRCPCRRP